MDATHDRRPQAHRAITAPGRTTEAFGPKGRYTSPALGHDQGDRSLQAWDNESTGIEEYMEENESSAIAVDNSKSSLTADWVFADMQFQQWQMRSLPFRKDLVETLALPSDQSDSWTQDRTASTQGQSDHDNDNEGSTLNHPTPIKPRVGSFKIPSIPDWNFLHRQSSFDTFDPIETSCPSLTSGRTVSSRNSSTRSIRSVKDYTCDGAWDFDDNVPQKCQLCEQSFHDIGGHIMLRHRHVERTEKCPIQTCEYHVKGFARAYDRMRHTANAHFAGTMLCGFCPGASQGSNAASINLFTRQDAFMRHLVVVHGAERVRPFRLGKPSRMPPRTKTWTPRMRHQLVATCSVCSEPFDLQGFSDHLLGCIYRHVCENSKDSAEYVAPMLERIDEKGMSPRNDSLVSPHDALPPVELPKKFQTVRAKGERAHDQESVDCGQRDIAELTASSRCLSLTSSNGVKSSDEETDWTTEDASSPQSQPDAPTALSPIKQQIVNRIMHEFHRILDQCLTDTSHIVECAGGSSDSHAPNYSNSSSASTSASDSPAMSRKRSLSGGSSPPPNEEENGDDPNKRRRPDPTPQTKETYLPERRFACPYYKRNPGRHQTFTSCRDPGFSTVARLKEHLYRRHLLPAQCNRCCATFPNEPSLREHQRDPSGCEIREQVPLEGFDKDQERRLKSKKRSLVLQSEEDKWKGVYRILFPDDHQEDMPSPYIEYQMPGNPTHMEEKTSNVSRFQEFSRLELPRLVRRTLEVVVEQEAQPLEEKLKERLVDIVKECQTQLFSMFQTTEQLKANTQEVANIIPQPKPASTLPIVSNFVDASFSGFDSFDPTQALYSIPEATLSQDVLDPSLKKPSEDCPASDSPDSGYDTAASLPADPVLQETYCYDENGYIDLANCWLPLEVAGVNPGFDTSTWSLVDPPGQAIESQETSQGFADVGNARFY